MNMIDDRTFTDVSSEPLIVVMQAYGSSKDSRSDLATDAAFSKCTFVHVRQYLLGGVCSSCTDQSKAMHS